VTGYGAKFERDTDRGHYGNRNVSLGLDARQHPIVVAFDSQSPEIIPALKQSMSQMLIRKGLMCPSIEFVHPATAALCSMGRHTGIVLLMEDDATSVVPVINGKVIQEAIQRGGAPASLLLSCIGTCASNMNTLMDGHPPVPPRAFYYNSCYAIGSPSPEWGYAVANYAYKKLIAVDVEMLADVTDELSFMYLEAAEAAEAAEEGKISVQRTYRTAAYNEQNDEGASFPGNIMKVCLKADSVGQKGKKITMPKCTKILVSDPSRTVGASENNVMYLDEDSMARIPELYFRRPVPRSEGEGQEESFEQFQGNLAEYESTRGTRIQALPSLVREAVKEASRLHPGMKTTAESDSLATALATAILPAGSFVLPGLSERLEEELGAPYKVIHHPDLNAEELVFEGAVAWSTRSSVKREVPTNHQNTIKKTKKKCQVRSCRFSDSHCTASHSCGTCGELGHGQTECRNRKEIDALKVHLNDVMPVNERCEVVGCRFPMYHNTSAHQCTLCKLHLGKAAFLSFGHGRGDPSCPGRHRCQAP